MSKCNHPCCKIKDPGRNQGRPYIMHMRENYPCCWPLPPALFCSSSEPPLFRCCCCWVFPNLKLNDTTNLLLSHLLWIPVVNLSISVCPLNFIIQNGSRAFTLIVPAPFKTCLPRPS